MTKKLPPMKKSLLEYTPDRTPDWLKIGWGMVKML